MSKILFFIQVPPPVHGSSMVGQCIMESDILNKKFNNSFINLGTSKTVDEIGKKPIKKIKVYFSIIYKALNFLIFDKPDLVYIAITAKGIGFYKDAFIVLLIKCFNVSIAFHFHNKGVIINQHKKIDNFLYKIIFKNSKVILLSKYLYYDIKKYVKEKNVYYCPNGIESVNRLQEIDVKESQVPKILFLSNLIRSKGVFILLEALHILHKKGMLFICNLVGGEGDISVDLFNKEVQKKGLENQVFYLGKKFNKDKTEIFSNSDIFVHPTFEDCFPLVLLEAMQFSLPIISSIEGAVPEIVEDGINGFLVGKKNSLSFSNKLEILINDEELRLKMGQAGFLKYKNEYTLEKFENRLNSILSTIIKN